MVNNAGEVSVWHLFGRKKWVAGAVEKAAVVRGDLIASRTSIDEVKQR